MIIFDVEASGLADESYPIEIAWQDSEEPEKCDSFLIAPLSNWTHWDQYAEDEIHHISSSQLTIQGIYPQEACKRLNCKLGGKIIYSDAIEYDKRWVSRLFKDAGLSPRFHFGSIFDVLSNFEKITFEETILNETVKHRALDDVRQIIRLIKS